MAKNNTYITAYLQHIFNNTNLPNIGDATGCLSAATVGAFWISLHTADPGVAGNQQTNEATYTSYARVSAIRSAAGWTVSSQSVTNAATLTYPYSTGQTLNILSFFGVGTASSGAGELIYSGTLTPALSVTNSVAPQINAGGLTITES